MVTAYQVYNVDCLSSVAGRKGGGWQCWSFSKYCVYCKLWVTSRDVLSLCSVYTTTVMHGCLAVRLWFESLNPEFLATTVSCLKLVLLLMLCCRAPKGILGMQDHLDLPVQMEMMETK